MSAVLQVDIYDGHREVWHVAPPGRGRLYVVVESTWSADDERHIFSWRYADAD